MSKWSGIPSDVLQRSVASVYGVKRSVFQFLDGETGVLWTNDPTRLELAGVAEYRVIEQRHRMSSNAKGRINVFPQFAKRRIVVVKSVQPHGVIVHAMVERNNDSMEGLVFPRAYLIEALGIAILPLDVVL